MRFVFWTLPLLLLRTLFYLAVFITPVLGVWLASSLVAYISSTWRGCPQPGQCLEWREPRLECCQDQWQLVFD
jgi:hypothetical protein